MKNGDHVPLLTPVKRYIVVVVACTPLYAAGVVDLYAEMSILVVLCLCTVDRVHLHLDIVLRKVS